MRRVSQGERCLILVAALLANTLPVDAQPIWAQDARFDMTEAVTAIPTDVSLLKTLKPPQAPPVQRSRILNIRLSPDLGDALPSIRDEILRNRFVRIAEPADYELSTQREFTQTLILIDALQPEAEWRDIGYDAHMSPIRGPRRSELGNIALDDYHQRLSDNLFRIGRAKALLALDDAREPVRTLTCLNTVGRMPTSPICTVDGQIRAADTGNSATLAMRGGTFFALAVRNTSKKAQYIYLMSVGTDNSISRVPLKGDAPTPAGAWAQSSGQIYLGSDRRFSLVTIASDKPLLPAVLEQHAVTSASPQDCAGSLGARLCGNRPSVDSPHPEWSATTADYAVFQYDTSAIGGGIAAPPYSAPWMAELYSTIPYTKEELAADDLKPLGEKAFLSERNAAELAHACGGTLIAPDLVITAAHCVAKGRLAGEGAIRVLKARRVRIGTYTLGSGGTTYAIDGFAVHAGYRAGAQFDDIALLHLKADRDTSASQASPIAMLAGSRGAPALAAYNSVAALGWGFTGVVKPGERALVVDDSPQRNPTALQLGMLQAKGWADCKKKVGADLGNKMLCAVPPTNAATGIAIRNVFSCVGDSGGPLVRRVGNADMLVGIASWSRGCGYANFPSVYTDISKYAGWIAKARTQIKPGGVVWIDAKGNSVPVPYPATAP